MGTWADGLFEEIERALVSGEMGEHEVTAMRAMATFCRVHDAAPVAAGAVVDLWGFGDVAVAFTQVDGPGWWADLDNVAELAGVDEKGKAEFWDCETDHDDPEWPLSVGSVEWGTVDGRAIRACYVNHMGALRLFLGWSPWAPELMRNLEPTFERAMVGSGLGDLFKSVRVDAEGNVVETGRTLSDAIRADGPVASGEVARAQAFSGPLGALEREGP